MGKAAQRHLGLLQKQAKKAECKASNLNQDWLNNVDGISRYIDKLGLTGGSPQDDVDALRRLVTDTEGALRSINRLHAIVSSASAHPRRGRCLEKLDSASRRAPEMAQEIRNRRHVAAQAESRVSAATVALFSPLCR